MTGSKLGDDLPSLSKLHDDRDGSGALDTLINGASRAPRRKDSLDRRIWFLRRR